MHNIRKWASTLTAVGVATLATAVPAWAQVLTNQNPPPQQNQVQQPQNTQQTAQPTGAGDVVPGVADANNQARNNPRNQGYNDFGQTPWFSNDAVRQQLNINDTQYNQLSRSYDQGWNRYNQSMSQVERDENLTQQQRDQRAQDLRLQFQNGFTNTVDSTFTNPAARKRFNQLGLQHRGYGAFNDPGIQQQLSLSDEQRQRFNNFQNGWYQRWPTWNRDYSNDMDRVTNQYNDWQAAQQNNINANLTPQQQQIWDNLTGNPYRFPAGVYFQNGVVTTTTAKPALEE